jgi:hypothetical protein
MAAVTGSCPNVREVKQRDDVELIKVAVENRDSLPSDLTTRFRSRWLRFLLHVATMRFSGQPRTRWRRSCQVGAQ